MKVPKSRERRPATPVLRIEGHTTGLREWSSDSRTASVQTWPAILPRVQKNQLHHFLARCHTGQKLLVTAIFNVTQIPQQHQINQWDFKIPVENGIQNEQGPIHTPLSTQGRLFQWPQSVLMTAATQKFLYYWYQAHADLVSHCKKSHCWPGQNSARIPIPKTQKTQLTSPMMP